MRLVFIAALAAATIAAAPASAVNLVANGSFETGNFSGWAQFADTSATGVVSGAFDCCSPTDGSFQAVFGPVDGFGGITQTLTAAAGTFTISFDLGNDAGAGNYVVFDGTTLLSNIGNQGSVHYSFTVTAGANPTLTFGFYNPPAYYNLDNVSVTSGAVPEAATWAMLIAGFGLVGAVARRRRESFAA